MYFTDHNIHTSAPDICAGAHPEGGDHTLFDHYSLVKPCLLMVKPSLAECSSPMHIHLYMHVSSYMYNTLCSNTSDLIL